jgi:hypothetical protein
MIDNLRSVLIDAIRLVFKNKKLLLLYWLTNLGFAMALTFPLLTILRKDLLHSAINSHFSGEFDFLWFVQFQINYRQIIEILPGLLYSITFIYYIIQLFFTGGLLAVSMNYQKNHMVDYFYGGVKYFFRFFIVFLILILLYFVILSFNSLLYTAAAHLFVNSEREWLEFWAHCLRIIIFLFLITVVNFIGDYTKVVVVVNDERNILRALAAALRFIKRNFSIVITLFLLLLICLAAVAVGYNLLDSLISKKNLILISATFVIQQMLIIFRLIIRMLSYTSELVLYNDLSAEVQHPEIENTVAETD